MMTAQQEINATRARRGSRNKYRHGRRGRAAAAAVDKTKWPQPVIQAIDEPVGRSGPTVRKPHRDSSLLTRGGHRGEVFQLYRGQDRQAWP